jgi:lipopolysaccharide heptosyltransferase II
MADVVLAIPALRSLGDRYNDVGVDVWCHYLWVPILEMANLPLAVIPFRRTQAFWKAATWIRGPRYVAAYLLTPALAPALETWLAGVPSRRGVPSATKRWLLTEWAADQELSGEHRVNALIALADPEWAGGRPPPPRVTVPDRAGEQFRQLLGRRIERPLVGLVPGCRSSSRRWPEGRFTALAGMLAAEGATIVVFGNSEHEVLAARVAAGAGPSGIDLGGRTSMAVFAAGLRDCDIVVASDNGGMHLAAAVATPVVGVLGPRAPQHSGPLGGSARALWASYLPCAPCRKDGCPRRGPGTFLPEARNECLQLVTVEAVARAVGEQLREVGATSNV